MGDQVSDHFSAVAQPTAAVQIQHKVSVNKGHARARYKVAAATLDLAPSAFDVGDVLRIMQFKSGDTIHEVLLTTGGLSTLGTADLGLHESGNNHDGAVIDADLFGAALAYSTAIARVDEFTAGALANLDRGQTLWELAAIGAATFIVDPMLDFDLTMTGTAIITLADETLLVEVLYSSGD